MSNKLTQSLKASELENSWYLINAEDVVLGRLGTFVADTIRGKNKPTYSPNMDCGDNIIIINADKIKVTGNKLDNKYYYHTGFPGGIKERKWSDILAGKKAGDLLMRAVKGMVPKGPLGRKQMKRLYIYSGSEHPHSAQSPKTIEIGSIDKKLKR